MFLGQIRSYIYFSTPTDGRTVGDVVVEPLDVLSAPLNQKIVFDKFSQHNSLECGIKLTIKCEVRRPQIKSRCLGGPF